MRVPDRMALFYDSGMHNYSVDFLQNLSFDCSSMNSGNEARFCLITRRLYFLQRFLFEAICSSGEKESAA